MESIEQGQEKWGEHGPAVYAREFREECRELERGLRENTRELRRVLRGTDLEFVQHRANELEEQLFEVSMEMAEAEARRAVVMRRLEDERSQAKKRRLARIATEEVLLHPELESVHAQLKRARALEESGLADKENVACMEQHLRELEARIEAVSLTDAGESSPLIDELRGHLMEIEIDMAGMEARREAMAMRKEETKVRLDEAYEIDGRIEDLVFELEELEQERHDLEEEGAWHHRDQEHREHLLPEVLWVH